MPGAAASAAIIRASRALSRAARKLTFSPPVAFLYNPLHYAREPFERYVEAYASSARRVILLGMNPGPWGMAQTGVPFGEVAAVRDWLGISGGVGQPDRPHPRVPVTGFACRRSEVSGRRLWSFLRGHYGSAEELSGDLFVSNYCPLMFLDAAGRNLTPDRIAAVDRGPLFALCDRFLSLVVDALRPKWLVGIGLFATGRIQAVLESMPEGVRIATLPHPSPANPKANRDWAGQARRVLERQGIWQGESR